MRKEYKNYLERFRRFNEWESLEIKKRSLEEKARQFVALYELGCLFPKKRRVQLHNEHLRNLIEIQKNLRRERSF